MGKKRTAAAGVPKRDAPRLVNIAELKGIPREGTLIHFTAEQWKHALQRIATGKAVPKYGLRLAYYPLPDGGGVVQPDCVVNPCEICKVRMRWIPNEGLTFECACRPDPKCPDGHPPPPVSNLCRFVVNTTGWIRIDCQSQGCAGRCRFQAVHQGSQILIVCACI